MCDDSQIGIKIGSGGDKTVYMYTQNKVIKFSKFALFGGGRVKEKLKRDYLICKKYFGDFIVEVEDVSPNNSRKYIEIQEFINGKPMSLAHASQECLLKQLHSIVNCQEQMVHDGYAHIDLIGNGGLVGCCLSNIFVDKNNELKIIDALLVDTKSLSIIINLFLYPLKNMYCRSKKRPLKRC